MTTPSGHGAIEKKNTVTSTGFSWKPHLDYAILRWILTETF